LKEPDWAELHRKDYQGLWTPFLAAASAAYRLGLALRPPVRSSRLPGFVLSVGNIVAGGTGKTPAVIMLTRWAFDRGCRAAVLSRGYRGSHRQRVLEVSDGSRLLSNAASAGDEPCLLAESLPGVPVIVARKRYLAGLHASRRFGSRFFILDDGFQHRALARDMNLLLMDATNPWGNGRLLPRGPLREPLESLERADVIILTRAGRGDRGAAAKHMIRSRGFSMPVFLADHVPACIVDCRGSTFSSDRLAGLRVAAFAGIGDPVSFRRSLELLGAEVVHFEAFPDHHFFSRHELDRMEAVRRKTGAQWLMTTEKDWIRIKTGGLPYPASLSVLRVVFSLLPGSEGLMTMISQALMNTLGTDSLPGMKSIVIA
jgi:tetraacyldisaccharide 4'-kinase